MTEQQQQMNIDMQDALLVIHRAAVRHQDDQLHQAAGSISRALEKLGQPCPERPEYRHCPVCNAKPGQFCIAVPGRSLDDSATTHRERATEGECA